MFTRTESFKDFLRFYPVTSVIVGLQIAIWLISILFGSLGNYIYQIGIGFNYLILQGEYWRLLTSIFLHAGTGHILFNAFSTVLFAPALEQMLGKGKFLFSYLFAGVAANVLTLVAIPDMPNPYVGASGAIYGLFGLYLFMVLFEKKLIDPGSARLITIIIIIGLVMTFINPGINITGHLFGFIAGIALGPIVLRNVKPFSPYRNKRKPRPEGEIGFDPNRWNKKRYRYSKYIKPVITIIFVVLVLLGILSSLI
ncbi:Membrane associated serine protease, rhomboid family [Gracilibacillus ureilyticus]|uniref:Membrane associated serine protease, rhomboid family n=1 Tax=Gracilibacillus ureilyticus TaxID=531814 RepID=A0A1H9NPY7_9BACI|nr:rhomboid family intramembrane serine protease [Gracilibacillus ureilyticus]SER38050.1 Membrane associated serine protease, rhomboid family [Gracilibacillus ureilyticus]